MSENPEDSSYSDSTPAAARRAIDGNSHPFAVHPDRPTQPPFYVEHIDREMDQQHGAIRGRIQFRSGVGDIVRTKRLLEFGELSSPEKLEYLDRVHYQRLHDLALGVMLMAVDGMEGRVKWENAEKVISWMMEGLEEVDNYFQDKKCLTRSTRKHLKKLPNAGFSKAAKRGAAIVRDLENRKLASPVIARELWPEKLQ